MATIYHLALYSIFRTTPEVFSRLYFVEICHVSEKLWLFNHKRADFWLPNFGFKRSLFSFLKNSEPLSKFIGSYKKGWGCNALAYTSLSGFHCLGTDHYFPRGYCDFQEAGNFFYHRLSTCNFFLHSLCRQFFKNSPNFP